MSKIANEMRSRMDDMPETDFETLMGLSKFAFLHYLDEAAFDEARCVARAGALAPDFSAHTLDADGGVSTELMTLSDLRSSPVSLIFGCYTCPIFRQQSERMKELIAEYQNEIQFVFVYVLEAHQTDGWNTPSNVAADIQYPQPVTLKERAGVARDWRDSLGFKSPVVLDWPDNRINNEYAGSLERLYVLDSEGVVSFKSEQGPYYDSHLEDWAAAFEQASLASRSGPL